MSITLKTYGEQLEEVQIAISKVMRGQRYELGGRVMWRADLGDLRKTEKAIQDNLDKYGDVYPNRTARTGRTFGVSFG